MPITEETHPAYFSEVLIWHTNRREPHDMLGACLVFYDYMVLPAVWCPNTREFLIYPGPRLSTESVKLGDIQYWTAMPNWPNRE